MSPQYEYECPGHGIFENIVSFAHKTPHIAMCAKCGTICGRIISIVNSYFGWRLTDNSHNRFATDEYERDV